jgi:endonuclease YncB( thermonuclease family)
MKWYLFLAAAASVFSAPLVYAEKQKPGVLYDVEITRVKDGDTVAFKATWLPDPLPKELAVRVFGVDTPEKGFRAQCPLEDERGKAATQFTTNAVSKSQRRQILLMDWDKFGGRVLGDVILDGQSLRTMLIQNGLAREYYGEAKQSWCK